MQFTREQKERYIQKDGSECPYCHSNNIDVISRDNDIVISIYIYYAINVVKDGQNIIH